MIRTFALAVLAALAGPPRRPPKRPAPTAPQVRPSNVSPVERRPLRVDSSLAAAQIDYVRDMYGDAKALEMLRALARRKPG